VVQWVKVDVINKTGRQLAMHIEPRKTIAAVKLSVDLDLPHPASLAIAEMPEPACYGIVVENFTQTLSAK